MGKYQPERAYFDRFLAVLQLTLSGEGMVRKINYATDLRIAFSKAVQQVLQERPAAIDPKTYNAKGREAVKKYVISKLRILRPAVLNDKNNHIY